MRIVLVMRSVFNLSIQPELLEKIRAIAKTEGKHITDMFEWGMRDFVTDYKPTSEMTTKEFSKHVARMKRRAL